MTPVRSALKRIPLILLALLLGGCGSWHRGFYTSSPAPVPGWTRIETEGTSFFHPVGWRQRDGYVSFASPQPGEVFMAIYFTNRTVGLGSQTIRIMPADGSAERRVPLEHNGAIAVPVAFTVEIPSFTIDGVATAPLRASFTWADRRFFRPDAF